MSLYIPFTGPTPFPLDENRTVIRSFHPSALQLEYSLDRVFIFPLAAAPNPNVLARGGLPPGTLDMKAGVGVMRVNKYLPLDV